MTTKFKKSFSPMLICWNDIKIHLGFEDSYFVPPPICSAVNVKALESKPDSLSERVTRSPVELFCAAKNE